MRFSEVVVGIGVWLFIGCVAYCWYEDERTAPERDARQRVVDEAAARNMSVSYDAYRVAKKREGEAAAACRSAVMSVAKWGAESDWVSNATWKTDGKTITIQAHDVKFRNGFGASAYVEYTCAFNLDATSAAIISIENY